MNNTIKLLLAEDEPSLGQIIKESLETRNFEVFLASNGEEAYDYYKQNNPDILVLDVMMPLKDGFTLAKEIRVENHDIPIIFLTAKSQTKDVIDGFEHGGNDYIKKPFSIEELIIRIKSLLQRVKLQQNNKHITIGNYIFNYTKQTLHFNSEIEVLTHRETQLLFELSQKRNTILDRSYVLKKLWGNDDFFSARSMDVFISKLRKRFTRDNTIQIINVRGYGYKMIY